MYTNLHTLKKEFAFLSKETGEKENKKATEGNICLSRALSEIQRNLTSVHRTKC